MNHVVKIVNVSPVTHDVKQFRTEKPPNYKFTPGQATDVSINKSGWVEKKHPFTFTSLNSDKFLEFTIKSYPVSKYPDHEGVTENIHKLHTGDELTIEDPWGAIEYKGKGVFIAGGAGITPFIAIFKQLVKDKAINGNKLLFSNKTASDVILVDKIKSWFKKGDLILTLTREKNKNYLFGHIDKPFLQKYVDDYSQNFYVCGKKAMVTSLIGDLKNLGANPESVVFEK